MDQVSPGSLAVVTGASSGIGKELAKLCVSHGYEVIIAADEQTVHTVASELEQAGGRATAVQCDLSTTEGVDKLLSAVNGRPIDALLANAGHGLGKGFLEQDFADIRHVVDTNITGTIYLLHKVGQQMQQRNQGRILITGSIAGFMPGSFQAVYNGTKAFVDSFSAALRNELKDTKVTVSCLMPGATETNFFARANMLDTKVGTDKKDDPADVAKDGFEAMMSGEAQVVSGWKNKVQAVAAHVTPSGVLAGMHRDMAEPGSAQK